MRKLIVEEWVSLDGYVTDKDGNLDFFTSLTPEQNTYSDADQLKFMETVDTILLGRKTYEMFASFWPEHEAMWPGVNDVTKYVVSNNPIELTWQNSELITGEVVACIKELKNSEGSDLQVHGSGNLAQALFKHDLVNELFLMTIPITLGTGNRLFGEGAIPAAFKLTDGLFASNGVVMAYYERAGDVKTGSMEG